MNLPIKFQQELESKAGMKLQLKFNDNRSTMLSVRWEPDLTKVSLHRMFLQAPANIMDSLACYLRKEDKRISKSIRTFIDENMRKLNYSHCIDVNNLSVQGDHYNLKTIYDQLNAQYFDNKLDLYITWFGKKHSRNRSRITFGLYQDPMKLIKINRFMDHPIFPDYVVAYIVYHEMLHAVCHSYYDERGIHRVHSKEFKREEKKFVHYDLAQNWIKAHHKYLFRK